MTTISGNLTDRIATLSPAKRALLELKLKQQGVIRREEKRIPRRATQEAPPLSFAQQRLWFLEQMHPERAVYNIVGAVRLRGALQGAALEQSLNEIVRRHDALRTTFAMAAEDPVQHIAPSLTLSLPLVDLTDRAASTREAEAQRIVNKEAHQPFDLSRGPLLRAQLIRLREEEHILVLTLHHIVADGWSLGVLYRELSVLYHAFTHAEPSPLPELSLQYADYAVWQRQWLQGAVLDRQLSYWQQQLQNCPAILNLPTDRPRPTVQTFHGAHRSVILPQSLVDALKELSRREQATLYMTMLAALQTLLYRYTGQEAIVVGSPIAGRRYKETEELIGFFVNTLALKTDLSGNPRFIELLSRVRRLTLEAYDHQDLPFEKLVEELQPTRTLSYAPLVQAMFAFQNVPHRPVDFTGLILTPLEVSGETAKFDLTLFLVEDAGTLKATMEYNTDLFEQRTVARMLGHYRQLLEGIVGNPEQRISAIPLLTDAERHQLLVEWNDTQRAYPRDKCVHTLFEAQVERSPDAVAVVFEDQHLTYSKLNTRANQLARHLHKLGVGPDTAVELCLERSLDMIVATLAVLKAGAAYVPLDPSYPQDRLRFMLADTAATVVLTQQALVDRLPPHGATLVCLDRDWGTISQERAENLSVQTTPDHLAYVIYTSGSTGHPKGVAVPHKGIVRLVCGSDYVQFDSRQVFLQLAPISFDAATFELWGALLHGAKCVLFPGRLPSPAELGTILHKHQVSTLWLTASLFNSLIDQAPEVLAGVRQLLTGGEALSVSHVRRALTRLPATQLLNGYGPTESTTFACTYAIPRHIEETATSIALGRPIANTQVYVLDAHLQPVPIGVAGELCIGGAGLARGYLNRPDLTAEQFIPNPFSDLPGARLYRTGDLARYLPDGNLEFLGRIDNQVKIRGFRIELGEIEAVLAQHPSVQASVVVAREDSPGDQRLVAYLVSRGSAVSVSEVRTFLTTKLPEYMIPSAFVCLEKLPLTPNGKIDRKALPAPDQTRPDLEERFIAPRTSEEEVIAGIWAHILGLDRVGIHDNFFDLGGHSLLATQVVWALGKRLGRAVPVATMFQAPTIAQLASLFSEEQPTPGDEVDDRLWGTDGSFLLPFRTTGSQRPFFCVGVPHIVAHYLESDQPVYGFQSHGFDGRPVPATVEEIATQYLRGIRSLQPEGPYFLGGYSLGGMVAFEMAQQLQRQGQEVAALFLFDPATPHDETAPQSVRRTSSFALPTLRVVPSLISHYVEQLRQFPFHEQRTRIWNGITRRLTKRLKPLKKEVQRLICQVYLRAGYRIPPALRKFYTLNSFLPLAQRYRPHPYTGRVILFKRTERFVRPQPDWDNLLTGEAEIYQISGTHDDVFKAPYFQTWVPKLVDALKRITKETNPSPQR